MGSGPRPRVRPLDGRRQAGPVTDHDFDDLLAANRTTRHYAMQEFDGVAQRGSPW